MVALPVIPRKKYPAPLALIGTGIKTPGAQTLTEAKISANKKGKTVLFGASRRIAILDTKKPAELGFMRVCQCLRGLGWEGLEPSTNALKGRCSTIELPTRKRRKI